MLSSTFELITLAASNSLIVFCFCNLIIVILLVGGSKPKPQFDESSTFSSPSQTIAEADDGNKDYKKPKAMISANHSVQTCNAATEASEISCVDIVMVSDSEAKDDEVNKDYKKPKAKSSANHSVQRSNAATEVSEIPRADIVMVIDSEVKDDEEDDELRKRVEEFIEKINKGWKAEKLRTTSGQ